MELPWEQTIQHDNTMTMRMQYSGYSNHNSTVEIRLLKTIQL